MIVHRIARIALLAGFALHGSPALAGVFTDDLSKCLVRSSGTPDQVLLVQWIFSAVSLNPAVAPLSSVTDEQRDGLSRSAAGLFQRLLLVDCRRETIDALKFEGERALETSFEVLGKVATVGLLSDPQVASQLESGFDGENLDRPKWVELYTAAGLPAPF
jgi:hypothetical protein